MGRRCATLYAIIRIRTSEKGRKRRHPRRPRSRAYEASKDQGALFRAFPGSRVSEFYCRAGSSKYSAAGPRKLGELGLRHSAHRFTKGLGELHGPDYTPTRVLL